MKFKITDECGKDYTVEKQETSAPAPRRFKEEAATKSDSCRDAEEVFTKEEIEVLKKFVEKADVLFSLVKESDVEEDETEETETEEEETTSVEEFDADEELLEIPEEDMDVEDSENTEDERVAAHDSKKSYGAIETKSTLDDSIDVDTEIAQAWAKHYGGNK